MFTEKLYTTRAFMIIGILLYGAASLLLALAHFWKKVLLHKIVAPIFWGICKLKFIFHFFFFKFLKHFLINSVKLRSQI